MKNKIMDVTGLADETVTYYLNAEFKQVPHGGSTKTKVLANSLDHLDSSLFSVLL